MQNKFTGSQFLTKAGQYNKSHESTKQQHYCGNKDKIYMYATITLKALHARTDIRMDNVKI